MNKKSTTASDRTVGVRIKTLRRAKGLSQTEMGVAVGVTFQQIQKYENGTNRITGSRIQAVARTLEVPVSALFDEVEGMDQPDILAILVKRSAIDLLKAYSEIEDGQLRKDVLTIVRIVARMGVAPLSEPPLDRPRRPASPPATLSA